MNGSERALLWREPHRHLVPGAAVELPSRFLFEHPSPLLEKKRRFRSQALISDVAHPVRFDRAALWALILRRRSPSRCRLSQDPEAGQATAPGDRNFVMTPELPSVDVPGR